MRPMKRGRYGWKPYPRNVPLEDGVAEDPRLNTDYPTVHEGDAPMPHHLPIPKCECFGSPAAVRQSRHELTAARAYYLCWQPTVSAYFIGPFLARHLDMLLLCIWLLSDRYLVHRSALSATSSSGLMVQRSMILGSCCS